MRPKHIDANRFEAEPKLRRIASKLSVTAARSTRAIFRGKIGPASVSDTIFCWANSWRSFAFRHLCFVYQNQFLAHLSQRLKGELIVYQSSSLLAVCL